MNKKQKTVYDIEKKKPASAAWWSVLLCGAGHWYLGKTGKGFAYFIGCTVLWCIFLGWIIWIIAIVSAHGDAKNHNKLLKIKLDIDEDG